MHSLIGRIPLLGMLLALFLISATGPAVGEPPPEPAPAQKRAEDQAAPVQLKVRPLKQNLMCGKVRGSITQAHQAIIRNRGEWRKEMAGASFKLPEGKELGGKCGVRKGHVLRMPDGVDFTKEWIAFISIDNPKAGVALSVVGARYAEGKVTLSLRKQRVPMPMRPFRKGEILSLPFAIVAVQRPPVKAVFAEAPVVTAIPFKSFKKGDVSKIAKASSQIITDNKTLFALYQKHMGPKVRFRLKPIDFKKKSIVFVHRGTIAQIGGAIEIIRIEHSGNKTVIHVRRTLPKKDSPVGFRATQPYHFVTVDTAKLKADFVFHDVRAGDPLPPQPVTLKTRVLVGFPAVRRFDALVQTQEEWAALFVHPEEQEEAEQRPLPRGIDLSKEMLAVISIPADGTLFSVAAHSVLYEKGRVTLKHRKWPLARRLAPGVKPKPFVPLVGLVAIERPPVKFAFVEEKNAGHKIGFRHTRLTPKNVNRASNRIITDAKEFARFLGGLAEIDFTQKSVVAVDMGMKPSSGYSIVVTGIQKVGDRIVIVVIRTHAGMRGAYLQMLTFPYDVVVVDIPNLKAEFGFIDKVDGGGRLLHPINVGKIGWPLRPIEAEIDVEFVKPVAAMAQKAGTLKVRPLKLDLMHGGKRGFFKKPHQVIIRNAKEWREKMLGCGYAVPGVKFKKAPVPAMPKGVDFSKHVLAFVSVANLGPGGTVQIESARFTGGKVSLGVRKGSRPQPMFHPRPGIGIVLSLPYALVAIERPEIAYRFVDPPKSTKHTPAKTPRRSISPSSRLFSWPCPGGG